MGCPKMLIYEEPFLIKYAATQRGNSFKTFTFMVCFLDAYLAVVFLFKGGLSLHVLYKFNKSCNKDERTSFVQTCSTRRFDSCWLTKIDFLALFSFSGGCLLGFFNGRSCGGGF